MPEGWSWSRATSILTLISGQDLTPDKYNSNNIGIPYITGASNFENGHITINRWTEFPQAISIMGDILLTCKGTIGEMAINIIGDTHIARQIMALRGSEYINNGYLELVMQSEISSIIKKADGLIPGISRPVILELLLPIAPSSEQLKIVESTKILLQNVNDINLWSNEIETIKSLIKSKVLELAIQGKLVPQDENDEPASVLLEHIRAERKAKLGKKYVESYIYKGDDNCYYENNVNNPVESPFVLPKNWAFSRLADIAWLEDGIKIDGEQLPYLDAKTIRGKQTASMLSCGKIIEKGMQVILVDGENSGEVFEVPCRGYIGSTFKVLQVSSEIEKSYVKLILDFYKNLFKDNKTGSAIPHLNKKIFKSLIVAIPPISEQKLIVEKVNLIAVILKDGV